MNQSRQSHLDSLRGIAAFIVVMFHYFISFYPYTIFGNKGSYQQQSIWEDILFYPPFGLIVSGHFAVCLFFILSGYVLSYSYLGEALRIQKIAAAIVKRPIRLGGLVLFTIILGALLWHSELYFNGAVSDITTNPKLSSYWKGNIDYQKLLLDITTSPFSNGETYNPPLWTIKLELYGSMIVFLFVFLFGSFKYRLLILLLLTVAAFFKYNLSQGFFIGMIIADLVKNHDFNKVLKSKRYFPILLLTLFFYLSSYPNYVNSDFLEGTVYKVLPNDHKFGSGYPMLSALLLFVFVITNSRIKVYLNRPFLQFLGRISYGLYAIHFLVIGSISCWLFLRINRHIDYGLSFLVVLLSGLPLIIILAYLVTKYVDKPSIKLANFVGEKTIVFINLEFTRNIVRNTKKLITRRSSCQGKESR